MAEDFTYGLDSARACRTEQFVDAISKHGTKSVYYESIHCETAVIETSRVVDSRDKSIIRKSSSITTTRSINVT